MSGSWRALPRAVSAIAALVLWSAPLGGCDAPPLSGPDGASPGSDGRIADGATLDVGPDAGPDAAPDRGDATVAPDPPVAQARLFGADVVIRVHIELDDSAYARLRDEPREYVPGSITVDGIRRDGVGIRLKGSASFKPINSKAAFKVQIDHFEAGARLHGLRQMTFNNMVQDHTKLRERLAATAFARLGVPAPRVGYAEITVNDTPYGLYTHVEVPDEVFLERIAPGLSGGVLYEGDFDRDLWTGDVESFDLDAGEDPGRRALAGLIAGLDRAIPLTFDLDVGSVVDLDAMRAFFAAEMLIGHWDGYASQRNNYYIYQRPADGRWIFLPWGTDQTFTRTRDAFAGRGRLFRMCADWLPCRLPYAEVVERFADVMQGHDTAAEIAALRAVIDPVLAEDPKNPTSDERRADALADLDTFVAAHPERMRRSLTCLDPAADRDGDLTLSCAGDCDEADPTRYPGAREVCGDEIDQDCSEVTDDGPHCPPCRLVDGPGDARFLLCHSLASYGQPAALCDAYGTTLASVRDAEEQAALTALAMGRHVSDWWLGMEVRDGVGRWLDGHPLDYTAWAPDEPTGGGSCVVLGAETGLWREVHCGLRFPVLCRLEER